jgi:pimeloyl-ACP methyl ester carboxylesterase
VAERVPSREQSLALALAKAGYDVARFNYVGTWANTGLFSWIGGVRDTEGVLRFLRSDASKGLGVDASRVVLVGHSYGGWVALMTAARDPAIHCVVTMASANLGVGGKRIRDNGEAYRRSVAFYEEVLSDPKHPVRAVSATSLADETIEHADAWDLRNSAPQLRSRQLFFIGAGQDRFVPGAIYIQPLIDELQRLNAPSVRTAIIEGVDHDFEPHGTEVNELIASWIAGDCKN